MLGVIFVVTTPMVLRGLVRLHGAVARGLLVDETLRAAGPGERADPEPDRRRRGEAHTLRRLERDLHDGPQQRLVRLGMDISGRPAAAGRRPGAGPRLLDEAWQQSQDALAEIRTLSRGIAPPILAEQGLAAAITALAARSSVPTSVDVE